MTGGPGPVYGPLVAVGCLLAGVRRPLRVTL